MDLSSLTDQCLELAKFNLPLIFLNINKSNIQNLFLNIWFFWLFNWPKARVRVHGVWIYQLKLAICVHLSPLFGVQLRLWYCFSTGGILF